MKTSDSIKELTCALVEAQGEIRNPTKDADNPYYNSKYAALPGVIDATREILSKHGLVVIQTVEGSGEIVEVATRLCHTSGQWIEGVTAMKPAKQDPQGAASASTYARRYGLMAILGISGADDDGNDASDHQGPPPQKQKAKPETKPPKPGPPDVSPKTESADEQAPPTPETKPLPATPVANPVPAEEPLTLVTKIVSVKYRPAAKGGGKFYTIETADKRKAGTFSESLALLAKGLKEEKADVVIVTTPAKDGRSLDLVDVCKAVKE